jgi:NTE family protein
VIPRHRSRTALKKVGLALGGGAARGMAHVGIFKMLERENIPVDIVTGTSAGAIIGSLIASGNNAKKIETMVLEASKHKLTQLIDVSLPRTGLIHGDKVMDLLESYIGKNTKFSDLRIPFSCVAADIISGEEIVLREGSVPEAVRASISIPGIFAVVEYEGRYLVDGGIVNPVPAKTARDMGAQFVIGVNVIPETIVRVPQQKQQNQRSLEPGIILVLTQSLQIGSYYLAKAGLEYADVSIEPSVGHIGVGDFHQAEECIKQGELAMFQALDSIKERLGIR